MGTQRGVGTLMVAAVMAVALLILGAGVLAGTVGLAQRDVDNAADLAALSGAAAFVAGQDECAAAHRIATFNGAQLQECRVVGDPLDFVVSVTVQRSLKLIVGVQHTVTAEAHAGRLGSAH